MNRLEFERRRRGKSLRAFADEIGLASYQTLAHYCKNGVRPGGLNARALEKFFGRPVDELLAEMSASELENEKSAAAL